MFNCVMKYLFYNVFGEVLIIFFVAKIGDKKTFNSRQGLYKDYARSKNNISNTFTFKFKKNFMHSPFA